MKLRPMDAVTTLINRNKMSVPIRQDEIARWQRIYSDINIRSEIEKARLWLEANPRRNKSNIKRFLINWFARAESWQPQQKQNKELKMETKQMTSTPAGEIWETKDYGFFKSMLGNRRIDSKHVDKLKKIMATKNLQIPLIVNEKYEICDGQHRLEAAKILGIPVQWYMVKGLTIEDVRDINGKHSKRWTLLDQVYSRASLGENTCKRLEKYINEYKEFSPSTVLEFFYCHNMKAITEKIAPPPAFWAKGEKRAAELRQLVLLNKSFRLTGITRAYGVMSLLPGYNFSVFYDNIVSYNPRITDGRGEMMVLELVKIHNMGLSQKDKISYTPKETKK